MIVQFSLTIAADLIPEGGFSLIGLGVLPPGSSWGLLMRSGSGVMDAAPG